MKAKLLKEQTDETGEMPTIPAGTVGILLQEEANDFYFLEFAVPFGEFKTVVIQIHQSEFQKL